MSKPSRYGTSTGLEGDYEPGSRGRVLRNLAGIRRKREMDQAEFEALVAAQSRYLDIIGEETPFTSRLICEMHRDWLGGLYAWSGRYRTVELSKGGFRWPPAYLVENNMRRFEADNLGVNTPCLSGDLEEVCMRIARVHSDLLLIHPFRDGNGRMARWLADLMALQAGLVMPDYAFTGKGAIRSRSTYLAAVKRSYLGDVEPLASFFVSAVRRSTSS